MKDIDVYTKEDVAELHSVSPAPETVLTISTRCNLMEH